jgi:VanZ family protein
MSFLKKHRHQTLVLGAVTICVMLFIFVMSAMPGNESAKLSGFFVKILEKLVQPLGGMQGSEREGALIVLSFIVRKAAHFTEYAVLGVLVSSTYHSSRNSGGKQLLRGLILALAVGAFYAITDEIHQHFVPGRVMAIEDICIDSSGVFLGSLIVALFLSNRKHNND